VRTDDKEYRTIPLKVRNTAHRDVGIWYLLNGFYSSIHINLKCFPDEASYEVAPSPPFDSISSIRYSPTYPHQLLVSAWDAVGPVCSVLGMKISYFFSDCEII
jgi:hypothetical protein